MDPQVQQMMDTYERAQVQYRSTGDIRFKPAADTAKNAIESYIATLQTTSAAGTAHLEQYARSQITSSEDLNDVIRMGRTVRDKSKEVANDFIVANDFNQPMPIDWTKYYVKLGALAGLIGGIAVVVLTR
jgi:hypothetical protein